MREILEGKKLTFFPDNVCGQRYLGVNTPAETMELFSYKRGNYERMSLQLNGINFAQIFDRMSIETAFDYFYDKLNSLNL